MYNILTTIFYFAVLFVLRFFSIMISDSVALQIISNQLFTIILPTVLYFIITKRKVKDVLKLNPIRLKTIILTILISILIQPSMSLLSVATTFIEPNVASNILLAMKDTNIIVVLFAIAVTPALCEELAFRGVIFSGCEKIGVIKSVILNGLLFSLMHFTISQSLYAFALGALFGYLVYITQSIFTSIIAHFTINASQLLFGLFIIKYNDQYFEAEAVSSITALQIVQMLWIALITLFIVVVLLKKLVKLEKEHFSTFITENQPKDSF